MGSLFIAGCEISAPPPAVPPRAQPSVEVSRPVGLAGDSAWNGCPFPAQADVDEIDQAVVTLYLVVRTDGTPSSVRVVNDPGHGFADAARRCALAKRYRPAFDRAGAPIVGAAFMNVRFFRPPPDAKP